MLLAGYDWVSLHFPIGEFIVRVPTSKLYRAFPELDSFSDGQCEALMRRIRASLFTVGAEILLVLVAVLISFIACFHYCPATSRIMTTGYDRRYLYSRHFSPKTPEKQALFAKSSRSRFATPG